MNLPLPQWIDPEAWEGFCEMRKGKGKARPFTSRAAKMVLAELYRLHEAGHDANACLDQSTMFGWSDVYPVKQKEIPKAVKATATNQALEAIQAHEKALSDPEAKAKAEEARKRAMASIRRVA